MQHAGHREIGSRQPAKGRVLGPEPVTILCSVDLQDGTRLGEHADVDVALSRQPLELGLVLHEMTEVLADKSMREMYGEKQDAAETDDYWPFVCVNLTSPSFMHSAKE